MPYGDELLQQQKQADPIQIETQQEPIQMEHTIREHLSTLQSWDVAQEQTLEQRRAEHTQRNIQYQLEYCEQLQRKTQEFLPPAQANRAAHGTPEPVVAPKETFKEKQEKKRRLKEARKANPDADLLSYTAVHNLQQFNTAQLNSMNAPGLEAKAQNADMTLRDLRIFCVGYQVNKRGQPLTPQDEQRKQWDERFFENYLSRDLARRKPYLNRMTNELLNAKISKDMFTPEYLAEHTIEMKSLIDRMVYFQNIMADPINAPFFEQMDPFKRRLIQTRILHRSGAMGNAMVTILNAKGVKVNSAEYNPEPVETYAQLVPAQLETLSQRLEESAQAEQTLITEVYDAEIEEEKARLDQDSAMIKEYAQRDKKRDFGGLHFTSKYVDDYSFEELSKFRTMIETHPEQYNQHQTAVDTLYQELYRTIDALGDLKRESRAIQNVSDSHINGNTHKDALLANLALARQVPLMEQAHGMGSWKASLSDALKALLRGDAMTGAALAAMDRLGLEDFVTQYRLKKAFLGPEGAIAKSNKALRKELEDGSDYDTARSEALQTLGIRNSSKEQAKADTRRRGEIYTQLPQEIALHFHELEENGVDLTAVKQQIIPDQTRISVPDSHIIYTSSPGMDPINAALLEKFSHFATSEASIRYLREMTALLKDADVFGGSEEETLAFLSQSLLNSYGANFSQVHKQESTYKEGAAVRTVAMESCRTLLGLPSLSQMTQEEQNQLPPAIRQLLASYKTLLQTLLNQIRGGE